MRFMSKVIGNVYMPLSALLSRWIFRRSYSFLEWIALTVPTAGSLGCTDSITSQIDSFGKGGCVCFCSMLFPDILEVACCICF